MSVLSLHKELLDLNCKSFLLTKTVPPSVEASNDVIKVPTHMLFLRYLFPFFLKCLFFRGCQEVVIFHINGIWNIYTCILLFLPRSKYLKVILSPRGMLLDSAFKIKRYKKIVAWNIYQKRLLGRVDLFHVTSEQELKSCIKYFPNTSVRKLPNIINFSEKYSSKVINKNEIFTFVFIGRITKIKNLHYLISSFIDTFGNNDQVQLQIYGPDLDNLTKTYKRLVRANSASNVSFHNPVYGNEKEIVIKQSHILVLPSLSENFGMIVAESLFLGTPVICTENSHWTMLEDECIGFIVSSDFCSLSNKLIKAYEMRSQLNDMGKNAREFIYKNYTPSAIARSMVDCYKHTNFET